MGRNRPKMALCVGAAGLVLTLASCQQGQPPGSSLAPQTSPSAAEELEPNEVALHVEGMT